MAQVTPRLEGTYALLAITADAPGTIVAARRSSPLVLGVGEGENFVGSDVAAFVAFTKQAVEVDDDQIVLITAAGIELPTPPAGSNRAARLGGHLGRLRRRQGRLRHLHE